MLLVSTLDSTIRTLDTETGRLFQSYTGHKNLAYRSHAAFGVGEESIVFGDEDGKVFRWDVESVRRRSLLLCVGLTKAGQSEGDFPSARSERHVDPASPQEGTTHHRFLGRHRQDLFHQPRYVGGVFALSHRIKFISRRTL